MCICLHGFILLYKKRIISIVIEIFSVAQRNRYFYVFPLFMTPHWWRYPSAAVRSAYSETPTDKTKIIGILGTYNKERRLGRFDTQKLHTHKGKSARKLLDKSEQIDGGTSIIKTAGILNDKTFLTARRGRRRG